MCRETERERGRETQRERGGRVERESPTAGRSIVKNIVNINDKLRRILWFHCNAHIRQSQSILKSGVHYTLWGDVVVHRLYDRKKAYDETKHTRTLAAAHTRHLRLLPCIFVPLSYIQAVAVEAVYQDYFAPPGERTASPSPDGSTRKLSSRPG